MPFFGEGFTRSEEADARNGALNYGYAILRGCMARCLAVYGFIPWLGLHHDSTLNAWNLADDMMEPYRPVVDLFVAVSGGPGRPAGYPPEKLSVQSAQYGDPFRRAARTALPTPWSGRCKACAVLAKALVLPALLPLQLQPL